MGHGGDLGHVKHVSKSKRWTGPPNERGQPKKKDDTFANFSHENSASLSHGGNVGHGKHVAKQIHRFQPPHEKGRTRQNKKEDKFKVALSDEYSAYLGHSQHIAK